MSWGYGLIKALLLKALYEVYKPTVYTVNFTDIQSRPILEAEKSPFLEALTVHPQGEH